MKLSGILGRSIGLTQAVQILVATLVITVVLGGALLIYSFLSQRNAAFVKAEEVLTLAQGGATTASWTLDEVLAEEVITSVIALGEVKAASLVDESGAQLARAQRAPEDYGVLTSLFARTLLADTVRAERALSVNAGGQRRQVGTMSIVLDSQYIAHRFLTVATPVLLAGLFQALAIGLVLLWLSSRLVTSPLRRAAAAISSIDPQDPRDRSVEIPPAHRNNEFGHLLRHTNGMFERLGVVQAQLKRLATHDPLTKLPNRSFVVERLERALARAERNGTQVAVLFLDLDGFKMVNDSHGHNHGDDLLVQVAGRLRALVRSNDTVGRIGGDEFLIVIESVKDPEDVAPTVRRIGTQLARSFQVGAAEVRISCSIGIALFPDDGTSASLLMRHSDMAMYQAKRRPGTHYHFYAQEMSERMQSRLKLETALRRALDADEFCLAYQPKLEARTGVLAGCEALMRWQHGDRLVPAAEFIHVAEQTGIIVNVGRRVLDMACAQAHRWATTHRPVCISVNVSAQQLREPDFVNTVLDAAARHGIEPGMLELEITETVFIEELNHAVAKLSHLRESGFGISIDDFGTGYSSLAYLTQLPADALKIDRSFVSGELSSDVVLSMIIAMAQALQLKTVAEGVETDEQRERLLMKGCDVLQGYLLGRPMSAAEFEERFLSRAA